MFVRELGTDLVLSLIHRDNCNCTHEVLDTTLAVDDRIQSELAHLLESLEEAEAVVMDAKIKYFWKIYYFFKKQ